MPISVFASHNWGRGNENHAKVKEVVSNLRRHGIQVWFDETHMKGNIFDSMCRGIDAADVVLIFVTCEYIQKVQKKNEADNVRREFMYVAQKCPQKMLAVRFDEQLDRTWDGPVGMCLGAALYVDMTAINTCTLSNLVSSIRRHSGKTCWKHVQMRVHRPPPVLPKKLSFRERVRHVQEAYGITHREGETSKEVLDRLYVDAVHGADATFKTKLESLEHELGFSN